MKIYVLYPDSIQRIDKLTVELIDELQHFNPAERLRVIQLVADTQNNKGEESRREKFNSVVKQ